MEHVAKAFSELIHLVASIAMTYYTSVHGNRVHTRIDIFASFGSSINTFRSLVKHCATEMWRFVLPSSGADTDDQVEILRKWLAPQDNVLAFLASEYITIAVRPEEFTCNWFQSYLDGFFKGTDKVLLVEGATGTGKTTLANWAVKRLQRPVARRNVFTLSFFFSKCSLR